MKWASVGISSAFSCGKLSSTGKGLEFLEAATRPNPPQAGVINPSRAIFTYGQVSGVPLLASALDRAITASGMDWRPLGLKVALYDELRERRLLQPSGVEWAWAEREDVERSHIMPLNTQGQCGDIVPPGLPARLGNRRVQNA